MKAMESYHSGTVGFDILHTDVVEVERRTITIVFQRLYRM